MRYPCNCRRHALHVFVFPLLFYNFVSTEIFPLAFVFVRVAHGTSSLLAVVVSAGRGWGLFVRGYVLVVVANDPCYRNLWYCTVVRMSHSTRKPGKSTCILLVSNVVSRNCLLLFALEAAVATDLPVHLLYTSTQLFVFEFLVTT